MASIAETQVVLRYASNQYEEILRLMTDSGLLPATYAAWRRGYEERLAHLARRAITPVVVRIEPMRFAAWCKARDLPCDAPARLEYAEWRAGLLLEHPDVDDERHVVVDVAA